MRTRIRQSESGPSSITAWTTPGLNIRNLVVKRDVFPIVRGVSLDVSPGKVTVLLGANGAGKTTLLEAISGVIPSTSGSIALDGQELSSVGRRRRVAAGLGHVEQGRRVFKELTTEENLVVAGRGDWSVDEAYSLFPELRQRAGTPSGLLSGGEQQMLTVARALAARPTILMTDELSLGLAPRVASRLVKTLRELADRGLGVLLVEQFASLALAVGDSAYVLTLGSFAYAGDCKTLQEAPDILRRAYLAE